nr:HNH endonuclease [Deltaproteobacteria bacterium]
RSTEAERLVVQRVGQDLFRAGLLDYWEGRCAVTGLGVRELLRASHIKPWAECETDAERLDVFNGFLLEARIDAVFDQGFVTVADDGRVVVAAELGTDARELLGLNDGRRVAWLDEQHRTYLAWHRARVFRGG